MEWFFSVTRYWSYFPLFSAATTFPSDGCCNWFSRLSKIFLSKKINQKIRHFVFRCFLFFVVDRWNGIFLQDIDLIFYSFQQPPLFQVVAAATDSVDSRKLLDQKIRHFVFHCFLRFCYFCYMLTVVTLVITDKASDKYTMEANYSMLFISMYKNGKIIPIQRQ